MGLKVEFTRVNRNIVVFKKIHIYRMKFLKILRYMTINFRKTFLHEKNRLFDFFKSDD